MMSIMNNGYVYHIRNLYTNEFYFDSRVANVRENRMPSEDLWKKYFTHSNNVKRLINEYGKESFEVHRKNQSISALKRPKIECEFCSRKISQPNINLHKKVHEK